MTIDNNYSIWSSLDVDLSPEDMVLALEDRGMHVCEFSDEHAAVLLKREGTPEDVGAKFREFAASHGVSFPQGHLWLGVRLCSTEVDSAAILCDWLRLFGAIGIKNGVLHCDGSLRGLSEDELIAANAEVIKKLVPTAEKTGVRICLENLMGHFYSSEQLLKVIELVGSDMVGICLDTGHLNVSKAESQEHFILAAGSKLHALHIADNEGERDQHMMPFGRGNVNFYEVMKALKEVGYEDLFNYEIPGERNLPMVLRKAKTEYVRTMTEYLFAL